MLHLGKELYSVVKLLLELVFFMTIRFRSRTSAENFRGFNCFNIPDVPFLIAKFFPQKADMIYMKRVANQKEYLNTDRNILLRCGNSVGADKMM